MESDFYLNPVGQEYKKIRAFRFKSVDLFRLHTNLLNFFTAENYFTGEKKTILTAEQAEVIECDCRKWEYLPLITIVKGRLFNYIALSTCAFFFTTY